MAGEFPEFLATASMLHWFQHPMSSSFIRFSVVNKTPEILESHGSGSSPRKGVFLRLQSFPPPFALTSHSKYESTFSPALTHLFTSHLHLPAQQARVRRLVGSRGAESALRSPETLLSKAA